METKRWWMVGHDDRTWGPYERDALAAWVAQGKLRADGLVCAEGDTRWVPIGSVPELAGLGFGTRPEPAAPVHSAETPLPPPAPSEPWRAPEPPARSALRPNELDPIPGWSTVLLSIPTLGLWGVFAFYRTLRAYRRLAGEPQSSAEGLFWSFLALTVTGILSCPTVFLGAILLVGALVVGALLLRETLRLRDAAILRLVPQAAVSAAHYPAVKSDDWHFGLWITGGVLNLTVIGAVVGLPIWIAQALAWFEDWNRLSAIARPGPAGAAPWPAAG